MDASRLAATDEFLVPFKYWTDQLRDRRDIFLGYCSSSASTAAQIKRYLASQNASVLDWQSDFIPGRTIIDQIEEAAARSIAGIFLFTKDDDLANPSDAHQSVPRETSCRSGHQRLKGGNVLIVREAGSKMPADLGGDIYAALMDRNDIAPIERTLSAFIGAI